MGVQSTSMNGNHNKNIDIRSNGFNLNGKEKKTLTTGPRRISVHLHSQSHKDIHSITRTISEKARIKRSESTNSISGITKMSNAYKKVSVQRSHSVHCSGSKKSIGNEKKLGNLQEDKQLLPLKISHSIKLSERNKGMREDEKESPMHTVPQKDSSKIGGNLTKSNMSMEVRRQHTGLRRSIKKDDETEVGTPHRKVGLNKKKLKTSTETEHVFKPAERKLSCYNNTKSLQTERRQSTNITEKKVGLSSSFRSMGTSKKASNCVDGKFEDVTNNKSPRKPKKSTRAKSAEPGRERNINIQKRNSDSMCDRLSDDDKLEKSVGPVDLKREKKLGGSARGNAISPRSACIPSTGKTVYKCEICNYTTTFWGHFRKHNEDHAAEPARKGDTPRRRQSTTALKVSASSYLHDPTIPQHLAMKYII